MPLPELATEERAGRLARVGLNAHLFSLAESYRGAGVSRYIHSLLTYLPQVDSELCYIAYVGDGGMHWSGWHVRSSRWRTASPALRILWEQLALPRACRRDALDLLHAPVNVGPLSGRCPLVVTLHDLSFYLYPELFRPGRRWYQQRLTRYMVQRAARIIAVSQSTRADAVRILGVPEGKLCVIPNGVDQALRPIEEPERLARLRQVHGLSERMILYLGTLEPRKNITTLLEAYALLRRKRGFDHQLVIAGGKGWYYEAIEAAVERLGLRGAVLLPGYIPERDKSLWYSAADLFVYPSLYEGFGLPPLEAMACGTPVIVSNVSSLPEVVGGAGILVAPHDVEALATAIYTVTQDRAQHRALRAAGLERAQGFSWRATAAKTAALYHEVLEAVRVSGS